MSGEAPKSCTPEARHGLIRTSFICEKSKKPELLQIILKSTTSICKESYSIAAAFTGTQSRLSTGAHSIHHNPSQFPVSKRLGSSQLGTVFLDLYREARKNGRLSVLKKTNRTTKMMIWYQGMQPRRSVRTGTECAR